MCNIDVIDTCTQLHMCRTTCLSMCLRLPIVLLMLTVCLTEDRGGEGGRLGPPPPRVYHCKIFYMFASSCASPCFVWHHALSLPYIVTSVGTHASLLCRSKSSHNHPFLSREMTGCNCSWCDLVAIGCNQLVLMTGCNQMQLAATAAGAGVTSCTTVETSNRLIKHNFLFAQD